MEQPRRHLYAVEGWGVGEIWVRGGRLLHHVLAGDDHALAEDPGAAAPRGGGPAVTLLRRRFAAHLRGRRVGYDDVEVELGALTPFEQRQADALRAVEWGSGVTYGELAARAGRPGAARAAGGFCAAGGLSLVLPYHRVVGADGIGGWGAAGPAVKRRLLALEGVEL